MSWVKFVTMFCDGDGCDDHCSTDATTVPDAREQAADHHGWGRVDGEDLCRGCMREREVATDG